MGATVVCVVQTVGTREAAKRSLVGFKTEDDAKVFRQLELWISALSH